MHFKVTQSPARHKTDQDVRLGKGWVGSFLETLINWSQKTSSSSTYMKCFLIKHRIDFL